MGNVEGRDLYGGNVDVIVCDGFIGNVALKVSEGLGDMVKHAVARVAGIHHQRQDRLRHFPHRLPAISRSAWTIPNTAARRCWVCAACASSAMDASNANAIKNAIRVAAEFSEGQVNQQIEEELVVGAR